MLDVPDEDLCQLIADNYFRILHKMEMRLKENPSKINLFAYVWRINYWSEMLLLHC